MYEWLSVCSAGCLWSVPSAVWSEYVRRNWVHDVLFNADNDDGGSVNDIRGSVGGVCGAMYADLSRKCLRSV